MKAIIAIFSCFYLIFSGREGKAVQIIRIDENNKFIPTKEFEELVKGIKGKIGVLIVVVILI